MNKRGQFFLIAAIIIVGLVIGLANVVNSVGVGNKQESFYDLANEINFETKRVFDYGVYQERELDSLVQGYLENYTNYIAEEEVLFIYGNAGDINGLFFEETGGNVGISTGIDLPNPAISIQYLTGETAEVGYDQQTNIVDVTIQGVTYSFMLRKGQNFFFVIIKEDDDERFVAVK
jgi:hypothetical protein